MAGVLAGDLFASEDRYGTWKMVLTRSCTRRDLFAGKVLAVALFAVGLLALLAISSLAAGVLLVGAHPLVSLSGTLLSTGHCLGLVAVCLADLPAADAGLRRASRCCSRWPPATGSSACSARRWSTW